MVSRKKIVKKRKLEKKRNGKLERKQYETLEQTKEALYDIASDGSCWSMCCMKNPANGRLICCKCIRDIFVFVVLVCSIVSYSHVWNLIVGCPQCCKCMWCDDCCGTNPRI